MSRLEAQKSDNSSPDDNLLFARGRIPWGASPQTPQDERVGPWDFARAVFGFKLPGHGVAYDDCGEILKKMDGCLDVEKHTQQRLDKVVAGTYYVKLYARTCLRAECPICYEKWAGRQAGKIEHRFSSYSARHHKRIYVIHVTVSVPKHDYKRVELDYGGLRRKAYRLAKRAGIRGGCIIFHPFRQKPNKRWYFSPHFHVLGLGWIQGTEEVFKSTGYVIFNHGGRKSMQATALYILSHCGVHKRHHTVLWFGDIAYNNFNCPKQKKEVKQCPMCGNELRPVQYLGNDLSLLFDIPLKAGSYYLDKDTVVMWKYKTRIKNW